MPTTKALEIAQFAAKTTVNDNTGDVTVTGLTAGGDISTASIDDLQDVVITSVTTGQVLKYDGTNWINDSDNTGTTISEIDDIGDVAITSPVTGQVLKYNGTNWVNATDAQGAQQLESLLYSSLLG